MNKQISETPLTHGTQWYWPMKIALEMEPKPDVIFFMTDGAVPKPQRTIDLVKLNQEKTQINTIDLIHRQLDSRDALKEIAKA